MNRWPDSISRSMSGSSGANHSRMARLEQLPTRSQTITGVSRLCRTRPALFGECAVAAVPVSGLLLALVRRLPQAARQIAGAVEDALHPQGLVIVAVEDQVAMVGA